MQADLSATALSPPVIPSTWNSEATVPDSVGGTWPLWLVVDTLVHLPCILNVQTSSKDRWEINNSTNLVNLTVTDSRSLSNHSG